jgi:hypothetical protein
VLGPVLVPDLPGMARRAAVPDPAEAQMVTLTLTETGGHAITPQYLSMRDKNGEPTSGLSPFDFPVTAVCLECGLPVRCESYFFAEWRHTVPPQAAPPD